MFFSVLCFQRENHDFGCFGYFGNHENRILKTLAIFDDLIKSVKNAYVNAYLGVLKAFNEMIKATYCQFVWA